MNAPKAKIVFLGSDLNPISVGCLQALIATERYDLHVGIDSSQSSALETLRLAHSRFGVAGVLQRAGRLCRARISRLIRPNVEAHRLREMADLAGINYTKCINVNGNDFRQKVTAIQPDLIVVANFSQIIRNRIRSIPRLGVLNFHPSLLPRYRGPTPLYWILRQGETSSGVTVHFIDEGIDTGPIVAQESFQIREADNESSLTLLCLAHGAPLLVDAIDRVLAGNAKPIAQDESKASYFGFPRLHR